MKVWAIADLHLSGAKPKPMEKFGEHWKNHDQKISAAWHDTISTDDLVIVAGDTSWAMRLNEATIDLEWLAQLPGSKILIRGNHDYWWSSLSKMRRVAPESIEFINNSAVHMNNIVVAGARGWILPPIGMGHPSSNGDSENTNTSYENVGQANYNSREDEFEGAVELEEWTEHDEKILAREIGRLTLSLDVAKNLSEPNCTLIVAMHYPPIYPNGMDSPFITLIRQYEPKVVVYGHLHGAIPFECFEGQRGLTHYYLVSADYIDFQPVQIL